MFAPAVVVHGLPHARAALSLGHRATLLSPPDAGIFAGAPWWRAVIRAARAAYPAVPMADFLDCGDAPGAAMAALRAGQRGIVLTPCPASARVRAAAAPLDAVILDHPPPALDWALAGIEALAAWLAGQRP